jgi:hypothetical protein
LGEDLNRFWKVSEGLSLGENYSSRLTDLVFMFSKNARERVVSIEKHFGLEKSCFSDFDLATRPPLPKPLAQLSFANILEATQCGEAVGPSCLPVG